MADSDILYDNTQQTGIGTDVFIRKKEPGARIGVGYIVEIYENGALIDTLEFTTKKQIRQLIDDYKLRYHTNRSFRNEEQIHITYKTKEERGEVKPTTRVPRSVSREEEEEKKEEKAEEKKEREEKEEKEERKEEAMQAIDDFLFKKADRINMLLSRLRYPFLPMKDRVGGIADGTVDILPTVAPQQSENTTNTDVMSEEEIATEMSKRIVEYFKNEVSGTAEEGNANIEKQQIQPLQQEQPVGIAKVQSNRIKVSYEVDDLYNGIKHWLKEVRKEFKNYERTNDVTINRDKVTSMVEDIVLSGDPATIKEKTGIDVDQKVADVMKEVMQMEVGVPSKGKESDVGDVEMSTLTKSLERTAMAPDDMLSKILGLVNVDRKDDAERIIIEDSGKNIDFINDNLPETSSGELIHEFIESLEDASSSEKSSKEEPSIEVYVVSFWNHVDKVKEANTLDNLFLQWKQAQGISNDTASRVFGAILNQINSYM